MPLTSPLALLVILQTAPPDDGQAPPAAEPVAPAEEEEAPPVRTELAFDREWAFDKKEERLIRKVEREVVQGADDRFRHAETNWKVDTYGSARLAAELGVYLDAFEESVLECFDAKRQFSEYPTIKVFASRAEFQEAAPMKGAASLEYEAIVEPKGKSRHRIKILDNHLYTYIEETPDPVFTDLNLPALRAEAAKGVLIGFLGRPNVTTWFEKGSAAWFASWDFHAPKREALDLRRACSPGSAAIKAHLSSARSNWLPSLERLVRLSDHSWEGQRLTSAVSNDAWAESIVDLLLTEKRARRLREELVDDFVREGLSGTGTAILPDDVIRNLEKHWARHIEGYGEEDETDS